MPWSAFSAWLSIGLCCWRYWESSSLERWIKVFCKMSIRLGRKLISFIAKCWLTNMKRCANQDTAKNSAKAMPVKYLEYVATVVVMCNREDALYGNQSERCLAINTVRGISKFWLSPNKISRLWPLLLCRVAAYQGHYNGAA